MDERYSGLIRRLREAALGGSGVTDSSLRRAVEAHAAMLGGRPGADAGVPAARRASASAAVTEPGWSVSCSRNRSIARTRSLTGAVRQSSRIRSTSCSSPNARDATAPCARVQKTQ